MQITIQVEGQQYGPFDPSQLDTMVKEGQINGDELAWHEGMTEWKPLRELIELESPPSNLSSIAKESLSQKIAKNKMKILTVAIPLIFVGIIGIFFGVLTNSSKKQEKGSVIVSKRTLKGVEKVMAGYFSAKSVKERSEYVVDGREILSQMKGHYKSGMKGTDIVTKVGEASSAREVGGAKSFSVPIERQTKNRLGNSVTTESVYWFQERNGKLLVDWMASVGFNQVALPDVKRSGKTKPGPVRMRVAMVLGDYYNYEFGKWKETHLNLRFRDQTSDQTGHAYVHRNSEMGKKFLDILEYDSGKAVTVLLRHVRASEDDSFWIIDELVREDWGPETQTERTRREALVSRRREHLGFALEQKSIDDLIGATDPEISFLPVQKVIRGDSFRADYEVYDYSGKRTEVVMISDEIKSKVDNILDGTDNRDQESMSLLVAKHKKEEGLREGDLVLLVHDLLYTGPHIETANERDERLARQGELIKTLGSVFGDARDEKVKRLRSGKNYMKSNLKLAKESKDVEYESALDVLVALWIASGDGISLSTTEQKSLVKSVLGTPDSAETGVFNNGNFLYWTYWNVVKNEDTGKVTEDVKIVFAGQDLLINVSGPNGLGDLGGGIRDPRGILTQTYKSMSGLWKLYSSIIADYFD